jgi:hypothetical protein
MHRTRLLALAALAGLLGVSSAIALPILRVDINSDNIAENNNPNGGYSQTEGGLGTPENPAFEPWFINGGLVPDPNNEFGPPLEDPRLNSFVYTGDAATSFVSKGRITMTAGPAVEKIDSIRRFGLVPGEGSGALVNYYYNDVYRDQIQVSHDDTSVYSTLTTTIDNNPASTTGTLLQPNTAYNVTFFVYDKFYDPAGNNTVDPVGGNTTMHFTDITADGLGMHSDSYVFSRLGSKTNAAELSSSPPTALDNYTWATTMTVFTDANGALQVRQVTPDAIAGGIIRGTAAQGGNRQISPFLNGFEVDNVVNTASSGAWTSASTWSTGEIPSNSTALKSQSANFFNNAGGTVTLTAATSVAHLNFAGTGSYTIAGNGNQLILDSNKGPNASVSIAARSGNHTINAAVRVDNRLFATINGNTSVSVTGDITFGSNLYGSQITDVLGNAQPTMLFKGGNGTLSLKSSPFDQVTLSAGTLRTTSGVSKASTLTFGMNAGAPTARLDLTGGIWSIDYTGTSPAPALIALLDSGRAGGAYTGQGISSSLAAADSKYAIGYAEASALGVTTVPGTTVVIEGGDAFLFRVTLKGDSNLNGAVNFDDLLTLAQNYQSPTGDTWIEGDSNYSGVVDFDDLLALAQNYNGSVGALTNDFSADFAADWALALSLVPEPTSLSVLGIALASSLRARRR